MNELELILMELAGTADGTSVPGGWAAGMERSPQGANEGRAMQLRKGMRIREATMRVGQVPQRGEILGVRGKTVDVTPSRYMDELPAEHVREYQRPEKKIMTSDELADAAGVWSDGLPP